MADKRLEEIIKKATENMVEITPEQMEAVNGGVITSEQQNLLWSILKTAKNSGYTKNAVLNMVPGFYDTYHSTYPNVTISDVTNFINAVWDSLQYLKQTVYTRSKAKNGWQNGHPLVLSVVQTGQERTKKQSQPDIRIQQETLT